ncbi:hypothetical protein LINPERHAP1_LOCUS4102, partial [Linum perenne]
MLLLPPHTPCRCSLSPIRALLRPLSTTPLVVETLIKLSSTSMVGNRGWNGELEDGLEERKAESETMDKVIGGGVEKGRCRRKEG